MTAGKHVAFEPAFESVLAEHLHDAAEDVEFAAVSVFRLEFGKPGFFRSVVDRGEPVGGGFVGSKNAEAGHVAAHHLGQKVGEHVGGGSVGESRSLHVDGIAAEVRQLQFLAQQAAVGVRVGGNAARAGGRKFL